MAENLIINYRISPTLEKFHNNDNLYRGVLGPVRSGKSTAMCNEIMRRAHQQRPGKNGRRRSRWGVIRNTYGELKDTTLKTWLDWFPEHAFGKFHWSDFEHKIRLGDLEMDVLFRALDRPDHLAKLLSMELTGAWVNEAREVPKMIIDALGDRVGQFPSKKDEGCTWRGVMMDTNPPDSDHWWFKLAETETPSTFSFFKQPGGLIEDGLDVMGRPKFRANPAAENTENLETDYYVTRAIGKDPQYVRVYYCAQYGFAFDGKPIMHEYRDATHCAGEILQPMKNIAINWGVDFGLTPAATFWQRMPSGRWVGLRELVSEDMGAQRFAELFVTEVNREFRGGMFADGTGDPAGEQRAQTDEITPFQIFNTVLEKAAMPIRLYPAPTNDFTIRREAVAHALNRNFDGLPGMLISPAMVNFRKGMAGGYCYRRIKVAGEERYHDKPDKNMYSHVCESGQYALLGAGEGVSLITAQPEPEPEVRPGSMGGRSRSGARRMTGY